MRKFYFAVPLVKNRNKKKAKLISKILFNLGFQITNEWVLWDDPNPNMVPREIYERDIQAIKRCDFFVCEVTLPSTGIGIELMVAKKFQKKLICIYKKTDISNLVQGMPGIIKIKYSNYTDLSNKLRSKISNLSNNDFN